MTDQHPINPPPELVQQWVDDFAPLGMLPLVIQAARWGADTELEACCEWFQEFYKTESWVDLDLKTFRTARRPKPPSLKKQALSEVAAAVAGGNITPERGAKIRLALEQLND